MSYRKITVNGKEYEYVIGKSYTKIEGVGLFYNDHTGTQRSSDVYEVTPGIVSDLIQGKSPRLVAPFVCEHGTSTTLLTADPYVAAILAE